MFFTEKSTCYTFFKLNSHIPIGLDCLLVLPSIYSHKQQSLGITVPAAPWYWHYWLFVMISKVAGTFILCVCDVDKSQISVLLLSGPDISQPNHWGTAGKTKPFSVKLIIIGDFSGTSSAGKGPPTSCSHLRWRCFCCKEHHCYILFMAVKSVSAHPDNPAPLPLQSTPLQYTLHITHKHFQKVYYWCCQN